MAEMQARPARDAAEVLAFADRFEPASTRLAGEVRRHGLSHTNRALVVDGVSGIAGAVVVNRRSPTRWNATVVVDDPASAPSLARAIDASPAWSLVGVASHVGPLLSHLHRTRTVASAPFHGSAIAVDDVAPPDPRIREATLDDLDGLVDVYRRFEQQDIPTLPRLRRFLRAALAEMPILVGDVEGRIVAAVRCDWAGAEYDFWWAQSVLPEQRGTKLGNALLFAAMAHSGRRGRKVCGPIGASNPIRAMEGEGWKPFMHLKAHHLESEWMTVRFGPLHRSLPRRAARRGWETLQGRTGGA